MPTSSTTGPLRQLDLPGTKSWPRGAWYVSAAHGPGELDAAPTRFAKMLTKWL